MFYSRISKTFLVTIVVLVFATAAYAFAASNTFSDPTNSAGDGADTISGYTVSNVAYTLDTSNPANVTFVDFDLDADATTVKVSLSGEALQTCNNTAGFHWQCPISGVTATAANNLRVSAAQ
jgi:hypothetical protein